eukprot:Mrub_08178.p1 GENE.Mrub_08178~~Mrub_08178.p1  ORF type:complete len:254 (-),score=38.76 Mrub_08178:94-855(-)
MNYSIYDSQYYLNNHQDLYGKLKCLIMENSKTTNNDFGISKTDSQNLSSYFNKSVFNNSHNFNNNNVKISQNENDNDENLSLKMYSYIPNQQKSDCTKYSYEYNILLIFIEIIFILEISKPIHKEYSISDIDILSDKMVEIYINFLDYDLQYPNILMRYPNKLIEWQNRINKLPINYSVNTTENIKFLSYVREVSLLIIQRGNLIIKIEDLMTKFRENIQNYLSKKKFIEEYEKLYNEYQILIKDINYSMVEM